jgi:hypothetical protein
MRCVGFTFLRLLLCLLAWLAIGTGARAGIVAPSPAATDASSLPPPAAPGLWVPYPTEFQEASQLLLTLVHSMDNGPIEDTGPGCAPSAEAEGGPLPDPTPDHQEAVYPPLRKVFLPPGGMGSPSSTNSGGLDGPSAPFAGCLAEQEEIRSGAVGILMARSQQFPVLLFVSRLFRPPRAGLVAF